METEKSGGGGEAGSLPFAGASSLIPVPQSKRKVQVRYLLSPQVASVGLLPLTHGFQPAARLEALLGLSHWE